MKRILLLPLIFLASCAPTQQIRPYTAKFVATPEQLINALKDVPILIPNRVCTQFKGYWGLSYGNPQYYQNSSEEVSIVIDSINIAKSVYGGSGAEAKFVIKPEGNISNVTANLTTYQRTGNELNPGYFSNCIPEIFTYLGSKFQSVK